MIDQLRCELDQLGEHYKEKNAVFKVIVIPYFCAIHIKKDHKNEGKLHFYAYQLVEVLLAVLFVCFGAALYNPELGLNHGPAHFALATFIFLHVIFKQIAIESLKTRLLFLRNQHSNSDN